jgi:hypothetical protein
MVIVDKFPPSSLTSTRNLAFNPHVVNTSFICNAMVSKCVYNFKQANGYMIKFPIIVQKLNN